MRKVTKEQFFAPIYAKNLDVHPRIVTSFPYTSSWEFHRQTDRAVYGKTVDNVDRGRINTEYFLTGDA